MKIKIENIINNQGDFINSSTYKEVYTDIRDAILSVTWGDSHKFIINPQKKGNGVVPIKDNFIFYLMTKGWKPQANMTEKKGRSGPGPIDILYNCKAGTIAVEWETGNISSSHRALNKIGLGIIQGHLVAGFLILPMKSLAQYLTDRIGNYEELLPYFPFYNSLVFKNGVIGVFGVEYDELSTDIMLIQKGKDGNAKK